MGAKPKTYDSELVERVAALYSGNSTQKEIAMVLGVSQKVIWNLMRRHAITTRVAAKRNQWGKNNHAWKGTNAGKCAFHRRLYSRFGKPAKCNQCGSTWSEHYDYANLTGQYGDLDDYKAMCRSCHARYDGKIWNIIGKGGMS